MHNISTIYRFNTPFLDIRAEKDNLLLVLANIKKVLNFDGVYFQESVEKIWDYHKISLIFSDELWRMDFFYINDIKVFTWDQPEYYLPVFKFDIFLNQSFLNSNDSKKKAVKFLTSVFECFDGTNEKEFLIDINSQFYFTSWLFRSKKHPHHDFSHISTIQKYFEKKNGMKLLENFVQKFSDSQYILTKQNSQEYHKVHWVMLYFIYLVYIIYSNLEKTNNAKNIIEKVFQENKWDDISEEQSWNLFLMQERLKFVDDLNYSNFKKYRERLNLFFKLF